MLCVMGTRPEAIKLAPVVSALRDRGAGIEPRVVATAQHRDMLDQVLDVFGIRPDLDLDVMEAGQSPTRVAARVLERLEPVLAEERPDWVLVQGDTTTVLATAIAAHYQRISVGHVEAGLRTGDRANPFPEETNRILADHIADVHFAPTRLARANLAREGIDPSRVHVTGNTVVDALEWIARHSERAPDDDARDEAPSAQATRNGHPLLLVTAHRRENHGPRLRSICEAVRMIAERHPELRIVYPVHPNPEVSLTAHTMLAPVGNVELLPPVDYPRLVELMRDSRLILTDSGGIQEEAPTFGVPVLVLRQTTERPEAVDAGCARVIGTDCDRIVSEVEAQLDLPPPEPASSATSNPFGDGRAAERIVDVLLTGRCTEFSG